MKRRSILYCQLNHLAVLFFTKLYTYKTNIMNDNNNDNNNGQNSTTEGENATEKNNEGQTTTEEGTQQA